jgi:hypothetical protein
VETTVQYSDAARRCSDWIRLHVIGGSVGRWAAIRLADGGSDGIAYDTRRDAIRHQLHEQLCAYVKVPPDDMTPREAEYFLAFHRKVYDAGFRLIDPDDDREVIMPDRIEQLPRLILRRPQ